MGFFYCVARIHESSFRTLRGDVLEEFIPKDNLFGGNRVSLKNRRASGFGGRGTLFNDFPRSGDP